MGYDYADFLAKAERALRAQTKAVPQAYGLLHKIVGASKSAIQAAKEGRGDDLNRLEGEMTEGWKELLATPLPASQAYRFRADSVQEYVEVLGFTAKYRYMVGLADEPGKLPVWDPELYKSHGRDEEDPVYGFVGEVEGVPLQVYLSGLQDVPGELSKVLVWHLRTRSLGFEERIRATERFLECAEEIHGLLENVLSFERVPASILDVEGRARFFQTFRGKLLKIADNISRREEELVHMLNTKAAVVAGLGKE